jgi:hypothetical protein
MNKEQCIHANWYDVGQADALEGLETETLKQYQEDCAKHGIKPQQKNYAAGYETGRQLYCTVEGGLEAGLTEIPYNNICSTEEEILFLPPYTRAKEYFDAKNNLFQLREDLRDITAQMDDSYYRLDDLHSLLITSTSAQEIENRKKIKRLVLRLRQLNFERTSLSLRVAHARFNFRLTEKKFFIYRAKLLEAKE